MEEDLAQILNNADQISTRIHLTQFKILTHIPMKKIIYTALLLVTLSLSFTACTEQDEITPRPVANSGGTGSDPK